MCYPGRRWGGIGDAAIDHPSRSVLIPRSLLFITLGCALTLSLPMAALAAQGGTPEERMATLVNEARIAQGLNPLAINPRLTAAAVAHARDMAAHGYMEHEGRDGSTPHQRAVGHGYGAPLRSPWIVVEVISARPTAEAAASWLLTDRLHRGVMLRSTWREMGVAFVKGGPYGQFWVIEFGCQPNVLPIFAQAAPGGGLTIRLTNEDCAPGGGGDERIGKVTEMLVSSKPDFGGARWEPFSTTKGVSWSGGVFAKLRDGRGREAAATAGTPGATVSAATVAPPAPITTDPPPLVNPTPGGLFAPAPGVE